MKVMRFLADMGVSQRVVDWLRSGDHDVVHVREIGAPSMPNGEIFKLACDEKRVVLTFDLDFGEIVALSGGSDTSVVLFRLNNTTTPFVIRRLSTVIDEAGDALGAGAIVVVEDGRHRIRRLPVGS